MRVSKDVVFDVEEKQVIGANLKDNVATKNVGPLSQVSSGPQGSSIVSDVEKP